MRQIILLLVFIAYTTEGFVGSLSMEWGKKRMLKDEPTPAKKISACDNIKCPSENEECEDILGKPVCILRRCPGCDINDPGKPVCGSDNKTYVNNCVLKEVACMEKQSVIVSCSGPCPCAKPVKEESRCPACDPVKNFHPVCGTDGKTYVNACVLKEVECMEPKDTKVLCKGECPCDPAEVVAMNPKLVHKLEVLRIQVRREEELKKELLAEAQIQTEKKMEIVEINPVPETPNGNKEIVEIIPILERPNNFMTREDVESLYSKKMQKWLKMKEEFRQKEKVLKEIEKNQMEQFLNKPTTAATCTSSELEELPSRLIDWFHVLKTTDRKQHKKIAFKKMKFMDAKLRSLYIRLACKNDPKRPDNEVFCLEPVEWMFNYLDKNNDRVLDHTELLGIENIPTEHCLKKFFLGCDVSRNGTVERKEFCRCLCVEPPCTREMENVPTILISGVPKPSKNFFIPSCDEDGFFMPQQCNAKKDCWCVDRNGGELDGTKVKGGEAYCEDNTQVGQFLPKTTKAPLPAVATEKLERFERKPIFVEP